MRLAYATAEGRAATEATAIDAVPPCTMAAPVASLPMKAAKVCAAFGTSPLGIWTTKVEDAESDCAELTVAVCNTL